jgi:predicted pyridoxine 5'-phosphate oxidase superfamily flavin-nucleotide-binding protein
MGTEIKKIAINEGMEKMIENNPLALSTSYKNGNPHTIVVADVKVIDSNKLLIGDNYMLNTMNNLKNNKNVSLAVWDNSKKDIGYGLEGTAEYFSSGDYLTKVKNIHQGYPAKGAIIINLTKIKRLAG